jgi:hypothetical protein
MLKYLIIQLLFQYNSCLTTQQVEFWKKIPNIEKEMIDLASKTMAGFHQH